jgi:GTP-binding protein
MVEEYLAERNTLKGVCLLVDIRHEPTDQDRQLLRYLTHYEMDVFVVATKADKVSANGRAKQTAIIRRSLDLSGECRIVCVSALKRTGVEELLYAMENQIGEAH